jgi:valyl-tRNA synthetase
VRLEKELAEIDGQIQRLETLLGGSFAEKAPAAVVERERQKLGTYKETAGRLKSQIQSLE